MQHSLSATGPATVALYCFCWGFYFPLNERKCSTTARMNAKLLPRALTCAESSTCETEEQQTRNLWLHHGGEWAEQQPKKDKKRQTNEDPTLLEGFPEEFYSISSGFFFWRCSKRGFVLLLHFFFFFFSLFLLSPLRVFQWHQQLPSGCWGGALGSIPSLYKSQRDVTGSISQPPSSSSSSSHPHLTHPSIRPSDRPSASSLSSLCHRLIRDVTLASGGETFLRQAFGGLVISPPQRAHAHAHARTHMYMRVVGCCRAPVLLRGDVGGWHDWDSQRIPPSPPVFAFSRRLVQQVDFS